MRRFLSKRVLLIALALLLLTSVSAVIGLYVYLNSPQFNQRIRTFVVEKTSEYTGAEVSLGTLKWNLNTQRLELGDITLRGTESASEPPLARIESIKAGVRLRNLLQSRVDLFELEVVNPEFHLRVDSQGRTNLPGPRKRIDLPESRVTLSIDSLKVTGGKAIINDHQTNLDFDIKDLVSDLTYNGDAQKLSAKISYAGTLVNPGQFSIPYKLSSEFDFTMGTVVAHKISVTSDKSSANLQGKIEKALTPELSAKLDYAGSFESSFLKHFLNSESIRGVANARGVLDFSRGNFSTTGTASSKRLDYQEWNAEAVKATYAYRYPAKELKLTKVSAEALGGKAEGTISVVPIPGKPRVTLELDYFDVDAAQLARLYPWDKKYLVYSRARGHLQGWFEGEFAPYEFAGDAQLSPYPAEPDSGTVALPAQGVLAFALKPGEMNVKSSDLHLYDTGIQAEGKIVGTEADLKVRMTSPNLTNLRFLYPDANGKGSFTGTLRGPIEKPILDGSVTLDGFKFRDWTIQRAEGSARLDTGTQMADLRDLQVAIGDSRATVNGTTNLDGSVVNLRIQSDHIRAEDFSAITKEKVSGILSGNVTVTSLNPLKVEGRINAVGLTARGHTLETFAGDLTYNDPFIQIKNAVASELGANLKAETLEFNRTNGALNMTADVSSLAFSRLRELGVPETIGGNIRQAHITVTGTQDRPKIDGNAVIENLSFRTETFPLARLTLSTNWPDLSVTLSEIPNVSISAVINLATANYPFTARAKFTDYPVERLANFSKGTLTASGEANFKGQLQGQAPLSGTGVIDSIQATVREYMFQGAKPFPFEFDSNRLTLTEGASFNGAYSTVVNLKGSIGLTNSPPLDLRVTGNLDLAQVTASYELWSVTGIVKLDAQIGGTASSPNLSGSANISAASLGREGIYTTLAGLNGDVRFNENRITFDNLEGKVSGGAVRFRGTGLIQNDRIEGMNVRIDAEQVRLRYPAGLRSSVTGGLLLRGTSDDPSLEGNLRVDSLTYHSEFEPFLALFRPGGLNSGGTLLDRLRLSLHVAGNRNVSIQNELTNITGARIDLDIKGTLGSPTLTGHVEANEGTLSFQGKRYEITRGNLDFVDPFRIDPVIDIQAETDLRDYRVILAISGRSDRLSVKFRSDPPLPELELFSLIAGGKTRDELARERESSTTGGNTSLPTSEQLFQGGALTGAASLLTDALKSRVGSRFGLMGLDWIRVDPHFEGTNNPSVRVTLSQQVSKDLSVTYSQDLASTQERIILIEYFLNKNLSILATREETNEISALGLDIKLRKRF